MSRAKRWLYSTGCFLLAALSIAAFFDAGTLHGGYELPYAGVRSVPMSELVFMLWYFVWGGLAVCFLAAAFSTHVARIVERLFETLAVRPRETVLTACFFVFLGALFFRWVVLANEPVADDELVYELSARNLALGRLTTRPSIDPLFLSNQFVIVDEARWHGKYPVGHSLLLAPFEVLGRADLLGPLLAAVGLALTFAIGKRFVGARHALLGVLLLALSPHYVWTHATLLSQTTSGVTMLLASLGSLRYRESRRYSWLTLMGAGLGFGILTRPMPGVLVAVVLILDYAAHEWRQPSVSFWRPCACALPFWSGPLVLLCATFAAVNHVQSGSVSSSGYVEVHSSYGALKNFRGELTNSLGGAFVRENIWLLGWPCSLLFVPLARVRQNSLMFFGLLSTSLLYRVLVPKTVVATTGPIYVTEVVPLLCLATASGIGNSVRALQLLNVANAREKVMALVTAMFTASLCIFVPVQLRAIGRGAQARRAVSENLRELGVQRAVVFANELVRPELAATWAYYPPNPWPDFRDPILFLRMPQDAAGAQLAWKLWRERFADRPAYRFSPATGLDSLVPSAPSSGLKRP